MYFDKTIHIEEDDQCYTCEHFVKGVTCPLLQALAMDIAKLNDDVLVKNCSLYKQFKRHLYVLEPKSPDSSSDPGSHSGQG